MDVQIEHLENHAAELTVKVPESNITPAKKKAARKLAKQLRIPGFRPGKAPYNVVAKYVGEGAILEEALDDIGNDIYAKALEESEIEPAAAGEFSKVDETEGDLVLTFTVPKAPVATLGDYRAIREEMEVEEIDDEKVNEALESIREGQAVVETVERKAKLGDELQLKMRVTWWHDEDHHEHDHDDDDDDDADDHDHEDDDDDAEAEAHEHESGHEHVLIDEDETTVILRQADDERDVFPGFSAEMVGLEAEAEKSFSIDLPEDFEDENLAGQTIDVEVKIAEVRNRTLPEWSDELAEKVSDAEFSTLLELRMDVRRQLEEAALEQARTKVFETVFEQILEGATVEYHDTSVTSYLSGYLSNLDRTLRQQMNIGLNDYLNISGKSMDELRDEHREEAVKRLERDAVMIALLEAEDLSVEDGEIEAEIDKALKNFGDQAEQFRQFFDTPYTRENMIEQLMSQKIIKRLADIAAGLEPAIGNDPKPDTPQDDASEKEEASES